MSQLDSQHHDNFAIPEGYFDNLTDRIIHQVKRTESNTGTDSGFEVPEKYFDTLTDQVMSTVSDPEGSRATRVLELKKVGEYKDLRAYLLPILAVAAAILGFIVLLDFNGSAPVAFSDLEDATLTEYVMNMEDHMDQESFDILFSDDDLLEEINTSSEISDKELIDFILEEADLEQIITQ